MIVRPPRRAPKPVAIAGVLGVFAVLSASVAQQETDRLGTLNSDDLRRAVERLVPEVESLRGLSFLRPVRVSVVDDEAAREHMLRRLELFEDTDDLEWESRALALLGIVPAGTDILATFLAFLEDEVGGYYDPSTGEFYLLEDMPGHLLDVLITHEMTHALEDQHYGIDRRLRAAGDDDDRMFARGAVHEGSATLLMTAHMLRAQASGELTPEAMAEIAEEEASRMRRLDSIPDAFLRPTLGSYTLGASFLVGGNMALLADGVPGERVDRTYRDGPLSSEQVLHPEKYWDPALRDDPVEVRLRGVRRALGRGWSRRTTGTLGELMVGVMVGAPTPRNPMLMLGGAAAWSNEAAAGWDGDRWELWSRGDREVVVLGTIWDSERDAAEFEAALVEHSSQSLRARRAGLRVAIVAGDDGERHERLLRTVLRRLRTLPAPKPPR